jgi:hypothetical protein
VGREIGIDITLLKKVISLKKCVRKQKEKKLSLRSIMNRNSGVGNSGHPQARNAWKRKLELSRKQLSERRSVYEGFHCYLVRYHVQSSTRSVLLFSSVRRRPMFQALELTAAVAMQESRSTEYDCRHGLGLDALPR